MTEAVRAPAARRVERLAAATGVLFALGAYLASLGHEFAYDDIPIIRDNPLLHSLARLPEILGGTWWRDAMYRPFTALSFAWDWVLSGGSPHWFHAVNIVLHGGVTLLVYRLARGNLGVAAAAGAAIVFAVHPVHVEAVANVVGRAELWAALFVLAAALLYRRDGDHARAGVGGWRRAMTSFGTLACALGALASKESAFALPALLLIVDWLDARRAGESFRIRFARHAVLWVASAVLALAWLAVWVQVVGGLSAGAVAPGLRGTDPVQRIVIMAPVALHYVRLLLVPAALSVDYSPDFLEVSLTLGVAGMVGLLVLGVGVVAVLELRRRAPVAAAGIAWVGAALVVVSNVLVPTEILLAERTLYLPSVGAVLVVGAAAEYGFTRRWRTSVAAVALVAGLFLARTITRVPVWHDSQRVFHQLVADAPGSFRAAWIAGMLAYQSGDRVGGERLLDSAIEIYPLEPGVWTDLANRVAEEGRWSEAARYFRAGYQIDSTRVDLAVRSALAYIRAGMADSAELLAEAATVTAPHDAQLAIVRAQIAAARGRSLEAMTWWRRVAYRNPGAWQYWYLSAEEAIAAGYCWEAMRSAGKVAALAPGRPELEGLRSRIAALGCEAGS